MKSAYTNTQIAEYTTKDHSGIRELLNASVVPGLGMSLAEATVEAQSSTEPHYHKDCDEIYYCLEGTGTVSIENEQFPFLPGSFYLLPKGTVHSLLAQTRIRLLCICSPGYSHEGTVLQKRKT